MNAKTFFNIKYNDVDPDEGMMLIAEPLAHDLFFGRSVVLLAHNADSDEYFGFIINKPLDIPVGAIFEELEDLQLPLHLGGPCEPDSVFFVHQLGEQIPNSKHIKGDLYWSIDIDRAVELSNLGLLNSDNVKFFIGYSGWRAKQLKDELRRDQWIVTPYNKDIFWKTTYDRIWKTSIKELSPQYDRWLIVPENPNYN